MRRPSTLIRHSGEGRNPVPAPYKTSPNNPTNLRNRTLDAYFVTIYTQNRECFLGEVEDGKMRLNDAGRLAKVVWEELPRHDPHIQLDTYVIMPNHVHGIV